MKKNLLYGHELSRNLPWRYNDICYSNCTCKQKLNLPCTVSLTNMDAR